MKGQEETGIKWQCCFCGETVGTDQKLLLTLYPADEAEQNLVCHSRCLQTRLHPSVPFLENEGAA